VYRGKVTDDSLIGIPYHPGGRDVSGLDCIGLLYITYEKLFKTHLPEYDIEGMTDKWFTDKITFWGDLAVHFNLFTKPSTRGDILILKIPGAPKPHFGVWLDESNYFLHIHEGISVTKTHYTRPWDRFTLTVLRPKVKTDG